MHVTRKLRAMDNGGARKRVGPRTLRGTTGAGNYPTLQYSGAINRVILIDRDWSIKWRRREKRADANCPLHKIIVLLVFFSQH
jgi:hypothetical protein